MTTATRLLPVVLAGLLAASAAQARVSDVTDPELPRTLPDAGAVSVEWTDPAQFTEIRHSRNRWEAKRGDWVRQLAEHLRDSAQERLPEGQQLAVTITDIRRAGSYEPWLGPQFDDVRMMRDIYWPRITLSFTRTDAAGNVVAEGERTLSDAGYLNSSPVARQSDPLRYEKAMLDRWVRRELQAPGV